jgi:hypothetical protein
LTEKNKGNLKDSYKKSHDVALRVLLDSTSAREQDNESFRCQPEDLVLLQAVDKEASCSE